ncbi:sulfite exporter TauE/SafE family protein [Thalassobaculum sp.]|uniref:HoxN/HupN/NixA family nickel/cobalt transporter n=1 Tax=Thalassobaculum sp. TaxID=2022740 RepID=UPI0032EFECAB
MIALQKWLYTGAMDAFDAARAAGVAEMPVLAATAFAFGLLHALLPGHGKALLTSYYAAEGRLLGAIGSSAILIATHVGMAVVLVLGGFAVVQRGLVGPGAAPEVERASQVMIAAVGCWLLWRALRPRVRAAARSGPVLGLVGGLVPCPLTTFVMSYAVVKGAVGIGLLLSAAFAAGMIATVASFPLIAVAARGRLLAALERTRGWRGRAGRALEIVSASAIVLLGAGPLL